MTRLGFLAAALLVGCTSDRAQRLVGSDFTEIGPILQCGKRSGIDNVGFSVIRMSIEDAKAIGSDPERLMRFPELNPSINGLKLVRWRSGPLSEEGRSAFELGLEGLVGDCEEKSRKFTNRSCCPVDRRRSTLTNSFPSMAVWLLRHSASTSWISKVASSMSWRISLEHRAAEQGLAPDKARRCGSLRGQSLRRALQVKAGVRRALEK